MAASTVAGYALAVGAFRFGGWELRLPSEQWRWFVRTGWRVAVTAVVDASLAAIDIRPRWLVTMARASVAFAGCALTYAHNVVGKAPSTGAPSKAGVVLVTGATAGIGRATAAALTRRGLTVIVPARNAAKAVATAAAIGGTSFAIDVPLELSDQTSVRTYANRLRAVLAERSLALTTIVLNAGVMRPEPGASVDGAELTIASNHLGHHALTTTLLPELRASSRLGYDCRVIVVSSGLHRLAARKMLAMPSASLTDFLPPRRREDYTMFDVRPGSLL